MNWENWFRLRPSSVYIVFFGLLTGFLGYAYSLLPEKPSDRDKLVWYFIGSTTITLGCLKWVDSTVSKEIEIETKKNVDEGLKSEMKRFMDDYSKDIEDLKEVISSFKISPKERQKVLEIFNGIQSAEKKFDVRREAAKAIAKWLSVKDNKSALIQVAMNAVKPKFQLSEEYLYEFDKNIRECIIWLRHSIEPQKAREFEKDRYASAMMKVMPGVYEPYKTALNAIKEYIKEEKDLKPYYEKTPIVEEMIQYLTKEIKQLSAQTK